VSSDLLPPSSTKQERAISLTLARSIPVPLKTLWDPWSCPADTLAWLGWALAVDGWDANWTEAQKRGAIAASIAIHKTKGTIGAMRRALQAIGYEVDIDEATGQVFTFNILLDTAGREFTQTELDRIQATALSAKNARSHFGTLSLRSNSPASAYYSSVVVIGDQDMHADPAPKVVL